MKDPLRKDSILIRKARWNYDLGVLLTLTYGVLGKRYYVRQRLNDGSDSVQEFNTKCNSLRRRYLLRY